MNDDRPPDPEVESIPNLSDRDVPDAGASLDEIHQLLANERRREILSYLTSYAGEQVDVDELVSVVAEGERPSPAPGTHRERVEVDLHHVHLPTLADAGVVDFDPVAGTVVYEEIAEIAAFLALGEDLQ